MTQNVFRSQWERLLGKTDSPIEAMFLEQFCALAVTYGYGVDRVVKQTAETIVVQPQRRIDRYRVDFLIKFDFFSAVIEIAVECDGHQWHERTKEQAKRDRRRDRELQSLGFKVFRFTGSEINADPAGCAFDVLNEIMEFQTAEFMRAVKRGERQAA